MKNLMRVAVAVSLLLSAGAGAPAAERDEIHYQLSPDWNVAHSAEERGVVRMEFLRQGDDITKWKELFTYENMALGRGHRTPDEWLNRLKELREKECPGATEWNVIEKDEHSILYEWQAKPCLGWPEQHEIARVLSGRYNLFILRYTAKVYKLEPDTRTEWIKTLEAASVDSHAKSKGSEDVDSVIPFETDKVMAALKPAMESVNCNVKETTTNRILCKRPFVRADSQHAGSGGESVTAVLEAQGNQTHVRITTGKGFYGRLGKVNWSTPIYQQTIKILGQTQP
jgi:hypothetical protein